MYIGRLVVTLCKLYLQDFISNKIILLYEDMLSVMGSYQVPTCVGQSIGECT